MTIVRTEMRYVLLAILAASACKKSASTDPVTERPTGGTTVVTPAAAPPKPAVKRGTLERDAYAAFGVIPRTCTAAVAEGKLRAALGTIDGIDVTRTTTVKLGWEPGGDHQMLNLRAPPADGALIDKVTEAVAVDAARAPLLTGRLAAAALAVATDCKGWVVSPSTGTIYDAEQGAKLLPIGAPDARKLITLHAVMGENELGFIDTAGMGQLGLPELTMRNIPTSSTKDAATLVNVTAQTLIERRDVTRDGELDIDGTKLAGDWHLGAIKEHGGTAKLTWTVRWEEIDATGDKRDAPYLEIVPPGSDGTTAVGLLAAIGTYFGVAPDHAQRLEGMEEDLAKAGIAARAALGKLRAGLAKGIPVGDQLTVKAPFDTDQGNIEWMWVDVFKISGNEIEGTLDNDPDEIAALKAGAHVKVEADKISDFVYRRASGKNSGGFSFEVLRAHGVDVPPL